jgi:hypothetical protein
VSVWMVVSGVYRLLLSWER